MRNAQIVVDGIFRFQSIIGLDGIWFRRFFFMCGFNECTNFCILFIVVYTIVSACSSFEPFSYSKQFIPFAMALLFPIRHVFSHIIYGKMISQKCEFKCEYPGDAMKNGGKMSNQFFSCSPIFFSPPFNLSRCQLWMLDVPAMVMWMYMWWIVNVDINSCSKLFMKNFHWKCDGKSSDKMCNAHKSRSNSFQSCKVLWMFVSTGISICETEKMLQMMKQLWIWPEDKAIHDYSELKNHIIMIISAPHSDWHTQKRWKIDGKYWWILFILYQWQKWVDEIDVDFFSLHVVCIDSWKFRSNFVRARVNRLWIRRKIIIYLICAILLKISHKKSVAPLRAFHQLSKMMQRKIMRLFETDWICSTQKCVTHCCCVRMRDVYRLNDTINFVIREYQTRCFISHYKQIDTFHFDRAKASHNIPKHSYALAPRKINEDRAK